MSYENSEWVQKDYFAYLLRMWREDNGDGTPSVTEMLWRASLQSPGNTQRIGFTSLEELYSYLLSQAGISSAVENKKAD